MRRARPCRAAVVLQHAHHDHLVCLECGKIIEFNSELIEDTQNKIAMEYGFKVLHHRHELYGQCADCQAKAEASG